MTTGDDQLAQGDSIEPLEMRRGPNYYGQPGQYGPPGYGAPKGRVGDGEPPTKGSRVPLLLLVGALALAVAIIVLLLSL